jgi:hypothetical protein
MVGCFPRLCAAGYGSLGPMSGRGFDRRVPVQPGGTPHVWRVSPRVHDAGRALSARARRPRTLLGPLHRPRPTTRDTCPVLQVGAIRGQRLEPRSGSRLQLVGRQALPALRHDPAVQGAGVPVKAPITRVRRGGAAPAVSASPAGVLPSASRPRRSAEEGTSISITPLQRTGGTVAAHTW